MSRDAKPYIAFVAAILVGVGTAAAFLEFGPAALVGLVGLLIWPGYVVLQRMTEVKLISSSSVSFAPNLDDSLKRISEAPPDQVQEIAAAQIGLLADFYRTALGQARASFNWALVGVAVGLVFFTGAATVQLAADAPDAALIGAIAGAVVELISGLNFVLYGRATAQLGEFHQRLERTQRFMLANSICEALSAGNRDDARAKLINALAVHDF